MKAPLFSIVIPTYNRSELVVGAIRSVLAQTCGDLEVVVSDNCSADDTREAVEGFTDPRVRYVRTACHAAIADSWEFARSQSRGKFVMMLSDDDALVHDALERFADAYRQHDADFMFCNLAEYRDRTFMGPDRNTVRCRPFSGSTRVVPQDEFLGPLFQFKGKFDMHPSAFIFSAEIAEKVVQRTGRFFRTNGVEYYGWPLIAIYSKSIVYIDAPLVILGRTAKSWGSNIVLANPGKKAIEKMINDVQHDRSWIPLTNFTLVNLMAEGMLLGKKMFADELAAYPFDEREYLRRTWQELSHRKAIGVDVTREIDELRTYAAKYPELATELRTPPKLDVTARNSPVRRLARAIGLNRLHNRIDRAKQVRRIRTGNVTAGFMAWGTDFGFKDAVECADFLARVTAPVLG